MAMLTIDDMRTVPQYMQLPWQVAKRMYHEACSGYDAMGWEEGESEESDGELISRYSKGGKMVKITYTELD